MALFFHSIASLVMAECACASLIFTSFTFSRHPTVNQAVFDSFPPLGTAKVKWRRGGDKRHRQMPGLLKRDRRKNLQLPYDLCRIWYYLFTVLHNFERSC